MSLRRLTRATALLALAVLALIGFGAGAALAETASGAPQVTAVYMEMGSATPIGSKDKLPAKFHYDVSIQFDQPVQITGDDDASPFIPLYRWTEQIFEDDELNQPAALMPYSSGAGTDTLTFSGFEALEPALTPSQVYAEMHYIILPTDEHGAVLADIASLHDEPIAVAKLAEHLPQIIHFDPLHSQPRYRITEGMNFPQFFHYERSDQSDAWPQSTLVRSLQLEPTTPQLLGPAFGPQAAFDSPSVSGDDLDVYFAPPTRVPLTA